MNINSPKGDTGETGATGPQRPQGPAGADGKDGETQDLTNYATKTYVDEKFDSLQSLEGVSF